MRRRLGAGETAGVILFGGNGGHRGREWRSLTRARPAGGRRRAPWWRWTRRAARFARCRSPGRSPDSRRRGVPPTCVRWPVDAGQRLSDLGVNVNLAPVADVAAAGAALGGRTFAGGPADVAPRTAAAVAGLRRRRRGRNGQALPRPGGGHGQHRRRGGRRSRRRGAVLEARELVPFRAAIRAARAAGDALARALPGSGRPADRVAVAGGRSTGCSASASATAA